MKHVLSLIFLVDAVRNYPEFMGYQGKPFPGQLSPRKSNIYPRRQTFEIIKYVRCSKKTALIQRDSILTFQHDSLLSCVDDGEAEAKDQGLSFAPDQTSIEDDDIKSTADINGSQDSCEILKIKETREPLTFGRMKEDGLPAVEI